MNPSFNYMNLKAGICSSAHFYRSEHVLRAFVYSAKVYSAKLTDSHMLLVFVSVTVIKSQTRSYRGLGC